MGHFAINFVTANPASGDTIGVLEYNRGLWRTQACPKGASLSS